MSENIAPRLYDCCGGAVGSVNSVFTQLHRSNFDLEFETILESVRQVVADLWQRNG